MSAALATLEAVDRALTAARYPALSPFWRDTFQDFVASARRQLVARVGRRGGKSSSLCRYAVAVALAYDCSTIPPGDVGVVAFLSTRQAEANARLRTIKAILDTLRVRYRPVDGGIELVGRPIVFQVFPATTTAALGFTAILVICDEVAAWRDAATGANPAREVLASLRPTLASQRAARIVLSSSTRGTGDAHARAFDEGNTPHQRVAFAPTWLANPTLTEAELRADEPDPQVFDREYAAIPQVGSVRALNPEHFDRCLVESLKGFQLVGRPVQIVDLAGGGGDAAAAWVVAWALAPQMEAPRDWTWNEQGDPVALDLPDHRAPLARLCAWHFTAVDGAFRQQVDSDELVAHIAASGRGAGARRAVGDQFSAYFAEGAFRREGMRYESIAWSNPRKVDAVTTVRRWMRDRTLAILRGPHVEQMRAEVAAFAEKITPNGAFKYEGAGAHDDRVALLLGAAMAEAEALLPGSPYRRSSERRELYGSDEEATDAEREAA